MDKTNALSLRGDGTFRNGPTLTYLIDDKFTDTVAAGSVNGTAATPGPGTRTVTDTSSKLSVGSGSARLIGASTWGDPALMYDSTARAAGVAVIAKWRTSVKGYYAISTTDLSTYGVGLGLAPTEMKSLINTSYGGSPTIGDYSINTSYTEVIVARAAGYFHFHDGVLVWVGNVALAPIVPNISVGVSTYDSFYVDALRVLALPAPFDTDDGIATDVLSGSVAAGTTFTHEANALIEATITTVPSADNIDIVFRQQDASNYWVCRIATGGDISLQEVVAGSPTQRGVAAGVVSNGHRVVVIAEGTTIKGYSNNTLRWTYSSATNFATSTAGEVDALGTGGVVSDLKTWPRTLSGTAASILNKASA